MRLFADACFFLISLRLVHDWLVTENAFHSTPKPDCLENHRPPHFSSHLGRTINHFLVMSLFIAGGSACYFRQLIKRCLRAAEEEFSKTVSKRAVRRLHQSASVSISLSIVFLYKRGGGSPKGWMGNRLKQESAAAIPKLIFPEEKLGFFGKSSSGSRVWCMGVFTSRGTSFLRRLKGYGGYFMASSSVIEGAHIL